VHDVDGGARGRAAAALRDLNAALVGHQADAHVLDEIVERARAWCAEVTAGPSKRRELGEMLREMFDTPAQDGAPLETFPECFVSGSASPVSMGLEMRRDGDAVAGTVELRPPYEGAPGRAHGGAVAAIFDDAMSYALAVARLPAYTGTLTVRYAAPIPVGVPVDVRAWVREGRGRRAWVDAELRHVERPVATATGLMITFDHP
jgi:acyl-coenzyme A thioesterase PaaI-like protein